MPTEEIASANELLRRYAAGQREFEQVRLIGADLHSAILHGIDLSEAMLSQANLSGADLRGADLSWADLSRANLEGANLQGSILTRADLSGANLSRANLRKADLSLADLTHTNFHEAIMPDGELQAALTPKETSQKSQKLKLYHHPVSANSRRVWVALLEKQLSFELIPLKLDGDQLAAEFLEINPFHHIPILVDEGFKVVESLAILDYLEAKYPTPALLPQDAKSLATVRMVELVTANELLPAMNPLIRQKMGFGDNDETKLAQSKQKVAIVLHFFEQKLGTQTYFGGDRLSLADIVAGTAVIWLPSLGVSLEEYPHLKHWLDGLMQRDSWLQTQPSPEEIDGFKSQMKKLMSR